MNPKQILLIVFAHRYLAAIVFLVVALVGAVVTLKTPKSYVASTDLLLESRADPIAAGPLTGTFASYLATQVAIIQSERLLNSVVKRLYASENPSLIEQWKITTQEQVPIDMYFRSLLRNGLTVEPVRGTNVIRLWFGGPDPKFVSIAANAYAQAYLNLTVDLRVEPVTRYAEWFAERQKALRADVEAAQMKLSEYQRIKGITSTDQRADNESQRLAALMAQLAAIQGENIDLRSRQQTSGGVLSADTQASTAVQNLRTALNSAEARMSELRVTLGTNHPIRVQLEEQIAQLRQQLAEEVKIVSGGTSLAQTTGGLRESKLRAAIAAQKELVISLIAERDEIAVLTQDVEAAKRIYDSVLQRGNQLDLEKQTDQANVSILSSAVEPTTHTKPDTPKLLGMTLAAAFGAAFAAAVAVEFLNRKVRVIEDIMIEDVPVLGVIERRWEKCTAREKLSLFTKFFTKRKIRKEAVASSKFARLT
jgi:polysaccharide biosynthesis transport protein